jgi:hypothetical protein
VLRETPYSHQCHNRTLLHVMILHCSARGSGCSGLLRLIPSLSLRAVRPFAASGMLRPGGPWVGAAFGSSASWWIGEGLSPRTLLVARHVNHNHILLPPTRYRTSSSLRSSYRPRYPRVRPPVWLRSRINTHFGAHCFCPTEKGCRTLPDCSSLFYVGTLAKQRRPAPSIFPTFGGMNFHHAKN